MYVRSMINNEFDTYSDAPTIDGFLWQIAILVWCMYVFICSWIWVHIT